MSTAQQDLWQATYRNLEQKILPTQLTAWIQPLEFVRTEQTDNQNIRLHLSAPNDFMANWVKDKFKATIESTVAQLTGSRCEIVFSIKNQDDSSLPPLASHAPSAAQDGFHEPVPAPREVRPAPARISSSETQSGSSRSESTHFVLDPRYTFDSYVVGASNRFAHASAVAVAEKPAQLYNPLFFYSQPGLGKTHLLHAIGNHHLARNPNARIGFISSETFVNELIDAIQHNKMASFRTKYRDSYDLLLVEDIQFIAGKKSTEEEFFHTFNALHSSRRQIVLTSDRPPKEITGLEERIRTRFEWGMVADIQPPEIETRIAILKAKAERDDVYLPDDIATFLATYIKSNVRELEGALIRLQFQASISGSEISLEMAKQLLKTSIPEEGSQFTVESIQNAVAKYYNLKIQDFKSASRSQSIVLPRHIAMYLIRKYTQLGFKEISHYFGGRDHSTIVHACQKIEEKLESDDSLREAIEAIQNAL